MSSFASGAPNQENGVVSPKLMITMVGSILAFLAITTGFLLVARKKRRTHSSPVPVLPLTHNHHHHQPMRRGVAFPVASATKCPACSKPSGKGFEPSRASYESLRSQAPLPPYTRYAPTGVSAMRPEAWRSASSFAASPTTPATPPSPPPAYVGRGPTASFRRAVY